MSSTTLSAPILTSPVSLNSLKRPSTSEQPNDACDADGLKMLEPDTAKPTIQQDYQMLSFFSLLDQHTIYDLHGHEHSFHLSLHLQGMFILAEASVPTSGGNPPYRQAELTCYRRNLFSVAGSVSVPPGLLSIITDRGERVSIVSQEVSISATESVDGNTVRLIVIPWKTPPPNLPQAPAKHDQEPPSFPILPVECSDSPPSRENVTRHIAWRRLQFRIATANNGRRKELQQHFVLQARVTASLSNGMRINVCEASTAPIVVRGRSPRNFQSKKETPLSSKSAAGTPMTLISPSTTLVEPPQASLSRDLSDVKSINQPAAVVPQSSFQLYASHLPRLSIWPSPPQKFGHSAAEAKSLSSLSRRSLSILHPSQTSPDGRRNHFTTGEPYHLHPSPPVAPSTSGSYSDGNPRPSKSPMHVHPPRGASQMHHPYKEHQEISFRNTVMDESDSYNREYFVSPSHPEPWVSTGQVSAISSTSHHQFQYLPNMYTKHE